MRRISVAAILVLGVALVAIAGVWIGSATGAESARTAHTAAADAPAQLVVARRLRPRPHAIAVGTAVRSRSIVVPRVFANASVGFSMASVKQAQYPVRTTDGGQTWRINGPQFHIDALDAPEAVGYVGLVGPRRYFAYGSSVVDVTDNAGHSWWESYLGDLVVAVVRGSKNQLVADVQDIAGNDGNKATTLQYVSTDGGHRWRRSNAIVG